MKLNCRLGSDDGSMVVSWSTLNPASLVQSMTSSFKNYFNFKNFEKFMKQVIQLNCHSHPQLNLVIFETYKNLLEALKWTFRLYDFTINFHISSQPLFHQNKKRQKYYYQSLKNETPVYQNVSKFFKFSGRKISININMKSFTIFFFILSL